jgi:prepilin-type N-terminal cleavage/methylation domain-containing protein
MKNKAQRGFTLIELMIVVAIIGILAAIAIPAFLEYINKSKKGEASLQLKSIETKVKTYFDEKSQFPANGGKLPAAADPEDVCMFAATPVATWVGGWADMGFHIPDRTRYAYTWAGGGTGTAAAGVATAENAANCSNAVTASTLTMAALDMSVTSVYRCTNAAGVVGPC